MTSTISFSVKWSLTYNAIIHTLKQGSANPSPEDSEEEKKYDKIKFKGPRINQADFVKI